jgi:hypothetical protein
MKMQVIAYDRKYRAQSIEIAREMVLDSAYGDMPFDGEKVMDQIEGPFSQGKQYFFKIAVLGDEVYGGFLGIIFKSLFCDQLIGKDIGWWVKKSKRGSAAAILLLREFEAWAQNAGAVKLMLGQASGIDIEKTTRLYQHCGYKVVGYNTMKTVIKGANHG